MGRFHPLQPAYLSDPYPYLARLRCKEPVLYSPDLQGYVLTRYADCADVLRDDVHFSSDPALESGGMGVSARTARERAALGTAPILANSDGAVHSEQRALLAEAFRTRAALDRRESVQDLVGTLVADIPAGKPVDFMRELAEPLSILTLLDLLGIAPEARDAFRRGVVGVMRGRLEGDRDEQAVEDSYHAAAELQDVVASARTGVVEHLTACVAAHEVRQDEMLMLLVHIATAGNAATAFAIGSALHSFALNPEAWDLLRSDPSLLTSAVEECLRFDSPTHLTTRFAREAAEVAGRHIPAGRAVYAVISSANRDPEAFPNPDSFDIARKPGRHLAFGGGPHFCLGASLARLEMEAVLSVLTQKFARLELADGGFEAAGTLFLRGPRRLVVTGRA